MLFLKNRLSQLVGIEESWFKWFTKKWFSGIEVFEERFDVNIDLVHSVRCLNYDLTTLFLKTLIANERLCPVIWQEAFYGETVPSSQYFLKYSFLYWGSLLALRNYWIVSDFCWLLYSTVVFFSPLYCSFCFVSVGKSVLDFQALFYNLCSSKDHSLKRLNEDFSCFSSNSIFYFICVQLL